MARYLVTIAYLILAVIRAEIITAQTNPSVLLMDFSQNNNTYTWENSYQKNFDFDRLKCDLNLNSNSILLKEPSKRWQEQFSMTFNADYRLTKGISLAPLLSHSRYALQNRKVFTSEVKLSVPVRQLSHLEFTPFIADRAIKREGDNPTEIDRGLGYGFGINNTPLEILNTQVKSVVSYEYYDLNKIPFATLNAELSGLTAFNKADTLSWLLYNTKSITRYYSRATPTSAADNLLMVVRQVKIDRHAEGFARLSMPWGVIARLGGDAGNLSYDYNYEAGELTPVQSDNYTKDRNYELAFEKPVYDILHIGAGYRYNWGEADYRGQVLDQLIKLGEISFKVSAKISSGDSLSFGGVIGVSSYYGLHSSSPNERDLKTQIYSGRYDHQFSRYFSGGLRGAYSSFHQIYISGLNSANNNKNETYLLQTFFNWALSNRLAIIQEFEIQANYITYDYVPNPIETPNRIFRRAGSESRFDIKISDRLTIMPGYIYRYEDYGKLIYANDNWQMATGWDRRYHNLNLKLTYFPAKDIYIEPDITWELKREYNHVLKKATDSPDMDLILREERLYDTKQIAGLKIIWNFNSNEYLDISYSRRDWDVKDRGKDITDFINISVRYTF